MFSTIILCVLEVGGIFSLQDLSYLRPFKNLMTEYAIQVMSPSLYIA